MISNIDYMTLQQLWWLICSVVGALFLFLTFVQGGQTLLWQVAKTDLEKSLVVTSLGRKWEMPFTTLLHYTCQKPLVSNIQQLSKHFLTLAMFFVEISSHSCLFMMKFQQLAIFKLLLNRWGFTAFYNL